MKCPVCSNESRKVALISTFYDYCDTCKEDLKFLEQKTPKLEETNATEWSEEDWKDKQFLILIKRQIDHHRKLLTRSINEEMFK